MVHLGVCLKDQEYADRICEYLNRIGKDRLLVSPGSPDTDREPDIWLTDSDEVKEMNVSCIYMGTVDKAEELQWHGERVDPYLPGSRLYRQCLQSIDRMQARPVIAEPSPQPIYVQENAASTNLRQHGRILSVYSPVGGIGKTAFARCLCTALAGIMPGEKVLYLNLEGVSAWRRHFRSSAEYNLSDYLYSMLIEELTEEKKHRYLEELTTRQEDGVFFIEPCNSFEDLDILEGFELDQLLEGLSGEFRYIVCDMNSVFHRVNQLILARSDAQYYLYGPRGESLEKWNDYRYSLMKQHMDETLMGRNAHLIRVLDPGAKEKKETGSIDLTRDAALYTEKDGIYGIRQESTWYQEVNHLAGLAVGTDGFG